MNIDERKEENDDIPQVLLCRVEMLHLVWCVKKTVPYLLLYRSRVKIMWREGCWKSQLKSS